LDQRQDVERSQAEISERDVTRQGLFRIDGSRVAKGDLAADPRGFTE
jgi:hypothetical protein